MRGPQQTRQIGTACRIYKNSSDETLAVDSISIVERTRVARNNQRLRTGYKNVQRTMINLGGTRTIAKIQMVGSYSSIASDFTEATWAATGNDSNDVTINLDDLPQIGDTI